MKYRNLFAVPFLFSLAVSCAPQSGGDDYDVANPYAAPDYVDDNGTPYEPGNLDPTYETPAAYETSVAEPEPSPVASAPKVHTVVRGDTLWGLSKQYGVSIASIKSANGLTSDTAVLGAKLQIPAQ